MIGGQSLKAKRKTIYMFNFKAALTWSQAEMAVIKVNLTHSGCWRKSKLLRILIGYFKWNVCEREWFSSTLWNLSMHNHPTLMRSLYPGQTATLFKGKDKRAGDKICMPVF